ncbi:MAG: hypothetical protein J6D38_04680 [Solobacterium sp.]|nr:hypothetical protein [Solobacterium sp.]
MKNEMTKELLSNVIENYQPSQLTRSHTEILKSQLKDDTMEKAVDAIEHGAFTDGFIDGFKYCMQISSELFSR